MAGSERDCRSRFDHRNNGRSPRLYQIGWCLAEDAARQKAVDKAIEGQPLPGSDDALSRRIVGSWTQTGTTEDGGGAIVGTETYLPNGTSTFAGTVTILKDGKNISYSGSGTWWVKGGKLYEKITRADSPDAPGMKDDFVGRTLECDIVNLTDEELTLRDKDDKIGILHRINK